MGYRIGSGYIGSEEIKTSQANEEVVPAAPANWTIPYMFYKFELYNEQECTVIINGKATIFLRAEQGWKTDCTDVPISSFVIVEPNISYNWVGCYL
ncbi:MAG TPA: hypothetical protein GYA04_01965 [Acholeplasma sp.]|nr:hypothetical protein [Acholeplasma sp.]